MRSNKDARYRGSERGTRKQFSAKRNNDKTEFKDDTVKGKSSANNPAWYASNAQLLFDSASLAYSQAIGTHDETFSSLIPEDRVNAATGLAISSTLTAAPGIMTFRLVPTVGLSTNNVSSVNIAANRLYSWVRHANAGAKNYDSPDLMLYLLAMDSIYSYYSYIVRCIGVCRLYSQRNRYLAEGLLTALGVVPDSIQDDFAGVRNKLNMLGAKMSALCIPSTMPYFVRHAWLYQNIYKDSPTEKSQLYAFVPDGFYKYEGFTDPSGGKLAYHQLGTTPVTIQTHLDALEDMLNAVVADEDINIMSGDILKAYGAGSLVIVGQVSEDFLLLPVYDEEVLSQIQNLTILGFLKNSDITQDATGALLYHPTVIPFTDFNIHFVNPGKKRITIRKDVVTPADTIVATRLTHPRADITPDMSGKPYPITSCGSEICVGLTVYGFAQNATTKEHFLAETALGEWIDVKLTPTTYPLDAAIQLTNFDWCPEMPILLEGPANTYKQIGALFDIDNYTIVQSNEIDRMNDTALLSMFNVPSIAPYSSMVK